MNNNLLIVNFYVDDLIFTKNNATMFLAFKDSMKKKFDIRQNESTTNL